MRDMKTRSINRPKFSMPSLKVTMIIVSVFLSLTLLGVSWSYLLNPDHFLVRRVYFEGELNHVSQQQLTLAISDLVKGNIFLVDLDSARRRLQAVPWVHRVSVRRKWPYSIYVQYSEQKIVAQWLPDKWVNTEAELVDLPATDLPVGLVKFEGPPDTAAQLLQSYVQLNGLLRPAGLQIAKLQLSARRSWRIELSNNLLLVLGRDAPNARVARFADVYQGTLANRVQQVKQVDLRYTNGFSVAWNRLPI